MSNKKVTLGAFIRREREAKNITLRKFADQIGVSPAFQSKVETADWIPGEDKLLKIAEILDCNSDELLALAGKVSSDLTKIIRERPSDMALIIRGTSGASEETREAIKSMVEKMKERDIPKYKG